MATSNGAFISKALPKPKKYISKRRYNPQAYSQQSLHGTTAKYILHATVTLGLVLKTDPGYSAPCARAPLLYTQLTLHFFKDGAPPCTLCIFFWSFSVAKEINIIGTRHFDKSNEL